MQQPVFIKGGRVDLRLIGEDDLPQLHRMVNDPEITQYLGGQIPITFTEEEEWHKRHSSSKDSFAFAIWVREEKKLIGSIGLTILNRINGTAITGTMIGLSEYQGQGYGTDAKMHLLQYAFEALNLRKVHSEVVAFNGRSLRYAEKCGYKEIGRKRKEYFKQGEYHDLVLLEVFHHEWKEKWEAYKKKHEI